MSDSQSRDQDVARDQEGTLPKTFTATAKNLHWVIALFILLMLAVGLSLEEFARPERLQKLQGHSGLGLVILALVLVRIWWRRNNPPPALPDTMTPRARKIAEWNTRVLYGLMVYMPTVGMLHAATYAEGDIRPFGLFNLTAVLPSGEGVTRIFHVLHALGGWVFMLVILLHILAAFKHLLIDRDTVFQRMLPFGKG